MTIVYLCISNHTPYVRSMFTNLANKLGQHLATLPKIAGGDIELSWWTELIKLLVHITYWLASWFITTLTNEKVTGIYKAIYTSLGSTTWSRSWPLKFVKSHHCSFPIDSQHEILATNHCFLLLPHIVWRCHLFFYVFFHRKRPENFQKSRPWPSWRHLFQHQDNHPMVSWFSGLFSDKHRKPWNQ